ncbi:MAG TPA: hypothetical protein IAC41_03265 [Candidatus Merdenecus merdavium]|nr:hypothetical protein [Candidatus Merdenecus merdavium]
MFRLFLSMIFVLDAYTTYRNYIVSKGVKELAEYRRFVSYMYQYDEDTKGGNAGFAKVETRNGTCRISIHVRGVFLGQNESCTVYGLVEDGRRMIAIPLGECKPKNGIIEHKLVTPSERMGESDYSFSDIIGIYVDTGRSKTYATTWAEKRLILSRMIKLEDYEKERRGNRNESETKDDGIKKSTHREPELHVAEKILSMEQIKSDLGIKKKINSEYQCNEPDEESIAKYEVLQKKLLEKESLEKENIKKEDIRKEDIEKEYIEKEIELTSDAREERISKNEENDVEAKTDEEDIETVKDDLEEQGLAQPYEEEYEEEEPDEKDEILQKWERLQSHYKRIRPFQDDEIMECIQIEPKDLVHLQKEEWVLGNNSFLLHGYFSYRYLIMGRTMVDEKSKIILGIPGVYQQQERVMANMFGFPYFKPASNQELKPGVFGYWCKTVK